jgi:hypothetical protein
MVIMVMVQMFFACTQSDDPAARPGSELQVSVTASGYASIESGAPETRATDAGYATSFANGDRIGVIAVQNNAVVQDNISYTYGSGAWAPTDAGKKAYVPFGTVAWIVYYPYSTTMDGKKTEAEIVAAFNVPVDQSSQLKYTLSDLMIWSGGMSAGNTLAATLTHRLAMAEIKLPANAGDAKLKVGAGVEIPAWNISGTTWRCLVKPVASVTVSGSHTYSATKIVWQQANVKLEAGKYTSLNIVANSASTIEGYTGNIQVTYTDNSSVTIPASDIRWLTPGKTVRSITLSGKTHRIGRVVDPGNLIKLKFDGNGNLLFRDAVDGFIPIGSYDEFQKIYDNGTDKKYRQEADLDLMNEEWRPIANDVPNYWDFYGEFDGAGKKISNLKITGANDRGLFRANRGTIRNVHIVSGTITVSSYSGGISGHNQDGSIISCSNAATFTGSDYVGGVTGRNMGNGVIIACYNTGAVSGNNRVGGVAGYNENGTVTACYNIGAVSGTGNVGSVVGLYNGGTVTACYWKSGTATDNGIGTSFPTYFNPGGTNAAWGTGTGGTNGWWKAGTTNNNTLPKLWFE